MLDPPNDLQAVEARRWAAQVARLRARNVGSWEAGVLYACGVELSWFQKRKIRECVATMSLFQAMDVLGRLAPDKVSVIGG